MKKLFTKKIIASIIIFIMIFGLLSLYTKSYGATFTYSYNSNDLPPDFDSLYPGYRTLLESLASNHPNWTFKLYETGLNWETVINNEYSGHGSSPKNLSPANDSRYSGSWICSICGTKPYDSGNWYCTSISGIEYMMDPRNSLNESDVFQFQELYSSTADTKEAIQTMVTGTFINTQECIEAIYTASQTHGINALHLISRMLQEQGTNGSTLGLGITENGITYYNLFNIGAYGNTEAEVINNGFQTAKSNGWTSMGASIQGGASFLKDKYINKGQNTLYYQKFNVVYHDSLYGHQYMQNILAAQNEGTTMRNKYINLSTENNNLLESNFTFNIPLYTNMPNSASPRPSTTTETIKGELAYVNASGGLALRAEPGSSDSIAYINEGTQVTILERATEKVNGYFWDRVYTPKGIGYMAREASDGSKIYLVVINQAKYEIKDGNIIIPPSTSINDITGATNTSATFGTGANITIDGNTYTLVMLGDANGDGKIDSADLLKIVRHLKGTSIISLQMCADPNKDGKIDSADLLKIVRHLKGTSIISL